MPQRPTFGFTEVTARVIPAVIAPYVVAKIGSQRSRVFMTGWRFDADHAKGIGLVPQSCSRPCQTVTVLE